MLKNSFFVVAGLLFVFLVSCKTIKSVEYSKIGNISDVKLRSNLKKNQLEYNKLYLKKVGFTFDDGKDKKSFKGSFVISKDSVIVASIFAPMGIELVRAQFNKEEVIIIDKHNKIVYQTDYDFFLNKYGIDIDYRVLQSILSNTLFTYPSYEDDYFDELKKYKNELNEKFYCFKSIKDKRLERKSRKNYKELVVHDISIYPEIFRIFQVYIKDFSLNNSLKISYSDFIKFESVLFPENIEIIGSQGNNKVDISLKINFLEVNDGGSLYFKIPSSYDVKTL